MLYYSAEQVDSRSITCTVQDIRGNSWNAATLNLDGENLALVTSSGVDVTIPWKHVLKLDFGEVNVVYLSDLQPLRVRWTPFVASPSVSEQLDELFRPRFNRGFDGGNLRLRFEDGFSRVEEFEKGFAVHSRTELVFSLPEGYHRLTGVVGIDEGVRQAGSTLFEIAGEDGPLFRETITGRDAPHPIDLDVSKVRRLTLLVDFADGLAIADKLNLCNFRLTK